MLRPGGAYVFTTEFRYAEETVRDPGNFLFGVDALRALVAQSPLLSEAECWSALAPHRANLPLPEDVGQLFATGGLGGLLRELPHVQLLRGGLPFSSAVFVLRKGAGPRQPELSFPGLDGAREFLAEAAGDYRRWLETSVLPLDPFSYLGGPPPLFHTRYLWLGGGPRRFRLRVQAGTGAGRVELRVHRQRTSGSGAVEPAGVSHLGLGAAAAEAHVRVDVDPDSMYAFVGEVVSGDCGARELATTVEPSAG